MKREGLEPEKVKIINIDTHNEFDTSIVERDIKNLELLIKTKKDEISELQNIRSQISEREEEMLEKYDIRIERAKTRLQELEHLLESDKIHVLEVTNSRDIIAEKIFGGDSDRPEIIQ